MSTNNGTSFGTPINISNNAGNSLEPQIATSGNNVYITWEDTTPGNFDIFVISNNQPFGFGTPLNISNNPGSSENPQIAADNNIERKVLSLLSLFFSYLNLKIFCFFFHN